MLGYRLLFFFFSSRRRHTRLVGDWSSDVVLFRSHATQPADSGGSRPSALRFPIRLQAPSQPPPPPTGGLRLQTARQPGRPPPARLGSGLSGDGSHTDAGRLPGTLRETHRTFPPVHRPAHPVLPGGCVLRAQHGARQRACSARRRRRRTTPQGETHPSTPTDTPTDTPTFTPTVTPLPTVTRIPPTSAACCASTALPRPTSQPIVDASGRWIEINLSNQTLTAYEGSTPVNTFLVS